MTSNKMYFLIKKKKKQNVFLKIFKIKLQNPKAGHQDSHSDNHKKSHPLSLKNSSEERYRISSVQLESLVSR